MLLQRSRKTDEQIGKHTEAITFTQQKKELAHGP
jgi:hypothetical protein